MHKLMSSRSLLPILFGLLFLLFSCGPAVVTDTQQSLPATGWSGTDTLEFRFDITDTLALYDIYLTAEHGTDYPNQNFYTKVLTHFPNGAVLDQTLSLELANAAGRWYGDCSSESCDFEVAVQRNAFFNQLGEHQIRVLPFVRRPVVPEIRQFGVRIEIAEGRRN